MIEYMHDPGPDLSIEETHETMFNLRVVIPSPASDTFVFECGCEVDVKHVPVQNDRVVYHHPPKEDLTLPLCPVWTCNHEFDCPFDTFSHYGYCTPVL